MEKYKAFKTDNEIALAFIIAVFRQPVRRRESKKIQERNKVIRKEYNAGSSVSALMKKYKLCEGSIYGILSN